MKKMKRIISLLLCMLMVVSLVAACGKKEDGTKEPATDAPKATEAPSGDTDVTTAPEETAEPFEISLGIWPEDTNTVAIELHEGYVKTFNETHPNVTVKPAYYKYAVDTFVPLAESGGLPTIFETWFTEPQKLINGGFVADITDILEERGWIDKMNPSIKDLLSKDGRIYGVPRDGYALGLYVNVAMFREAGLVDENGVPVYPKTWTELAETAKKIKDATGQAGFCLLARDAAGGWHFSNIAWAFGATFVTEEGGKYTATVDTPEAIAAMEYVKSLKWEYDVLTADPTMENWGTGFQQLGTGVAGMYIAAADAVDQPTLINGLPAEDLAIVPLPAGPNGEQYSLSGGPPYMFSADATPEQINAALDYLEVMGKAPIVTDASIDGMKKDAQTKIENKVPIIPPFPAWIAQDIIDAQNAIVTEFGNVDMNLYNDYFNFIKQEGALRPEEGGDTQALYAELTKVLQAVVTDENADVAALMKTADENYQKTLDDTVNK